jgi:GTP cyclohydrolase I
MIWIEDIIDICRKALVNETMVFAKRIDEMEHGIIAGSNPQFVEDSIRRLAVELDKDERILDWRAICSHRESIHNFDCHAVKVKGIPNSIFNHHISIAEYKELEI